MKTVAIQGVAGSFHDIAVRNFFKEQEIKLVPCDSFKELFAVIKKDNSIIGAVAIENTIAGSLLQNHNLLKQSGSKVVGEYKLRIEHQLVALPNQKIEDICEVHSHPIALMQCEDFLDDHKHLIAVESEDTALAAKEIATNNIKGRAAICSRLAAEMYGLDILAEGIETNKRNFTRFMIIAKPDLAEKMMNVDEIDKSSLVFTLPHQSGSLSQVLSVLSFYNMNLTKIQSLPIIGREWEYQFYINLTFDNYKRYLQALDAIRPLTRDFLILGEYKDAPTPM